MRAGSARAARAIFLLREGAFMAPALDRCKESRRLASLPEYVQRTLVPVRVANGHLRGVLAEAQGYAQNLQTLQFCVNELLPLLRSTGEASREGGGSTRVLPIETFRRLERRAQALLRHLGEPLSLPLAPDEVAGLVGAPCVILGRSVIPLLPAALARRHRLSFTVAGERYALRSERARTLPELLRDLRRIQLRRAQESIERRPEATRMASELLGEVKPILEECGFQDRGSYRLFHIDRDHQLQHSRGHWSLVRGPVANRTRIGSVFVGLHLVGRRRNEWLAVAPRAAARQGDFWTPSGAHVHRGICAGNPGQYRHLVSSQFTNAEAVIEWLDAGVILITGRSDLHRRLRGDGEQPLRRSRVARLQRPRR